jgi:hypothetical protein
MPSNPFAVLGIEAAPVKPIRRCKGASSLALPRWRNLRRMPWQISGAHSSGLKPRLAFRQRPAWACSGGFGISSEFDVESSQSSVTAVDRH